MSRISRVLWRVKESRLRRKTLARHLRRHPKDSVVRQVLQWEATPSVRMVKWWGVTEVIRLSIYLLSHSLISRFRVTGHSMEPTIHHSEHIWVLRSFNPQRGDIVVTRYGYDERLVKRLVGLPGDWVSLRDGEVRASREPTCDNPAWRKWIAQLSGNYGPWRVPEGRFFTLGDNLAVSVDSREFGALRLGCLEGLVLLSLSENGDELFRRAIFGPWCAFDESFPLMRR